jgi:DNA-binding IclR family transcriptional regulator
MNARNRPVAAVAITAPAFRTSLKDLEKLAPLLSNSVRELEIQLPPDNTLLAATR